MRGQVLDISTQIESLLGKLGASGRGIHERLTSVEGMISAPMVKKIRWIASVRNKAAHEPNFHVDFPAFLQAGEDVIKYLGDLLAKTTERERERRMPPEHEKEPEKSWADKTGWERAATVGTYVAAGAVTLGLLFITSK
ncbi:hypothetical protein [Pseudomonas sp. SWI44]|uniref:hypothetical protein n=1 Tax=Pseudomonas sp. SWI44 TaxID=2083053 RepID=UPI000CE5DAAC|nr:hypothetical protein [Pseudomonas sp. SWI44]AVD85933.1 hypothetical protein C4Q26_01640 [Pseudomonas sp. SWI44]